MNGKKQVKTAFTALLERSSSPAWQALQERLPEQQYEASAPTLYKKSYRRPALAAVCVLLIAIVLLGVFISDSPDSEPVKAPVSTFAPDQSGISGSKSLPYSDKSAAVSSPSQFASIANLPMMPAEPDILQYDNGLYITNSVFGDKATAKPDKRVGLIRYPDDVPVCSVKGLPLSKTICILSTFNDSKNYLRYDYLCKDTISAGGRSYRITSATQVSTPGGTDSEKSAAGGYKMRWIYLYQSPSVQQATKAILSKKLGTVASGAVYSIEEIDPANAVCLNLGSRWFYLEKANGYKGKTIDEVMEDNGFTQTPIN